MSGKSKPTLLYILREHNSLNGLRFAAIEFFLVLMAALLICASGILHGRALVAAAGVGVAVNAAAAIAVAATQILNHDRNEGLLKITSSQFRARIDREHPNLSTHTLIVFVSILTPFLLAALLRWPGSRGSPNNSM